MEAVLGCPHITSISSVNTDAFGIVELYFLD
jgi:hypothetical protein